MELYHGSFEGGEASIEASPSLVENMVFCDIVQNDKKYLV